ncbi:MAG: hypothetical protein NT076_01465 [Candidatus Pacearchaeota archaeon]|nr:hypothetical protein [Candidatus Pacearchaeota archaeon]
MKLNKNQAQEKIEEFFSNLENKTPEQVRKIKKLAMTYNIKLKNKRKLFCQECYFTKLKTLGIKNKVKRVRCLNCSRIYRWKAKD